MVAAVSMAAPAVWLALAETNILPLTPFSVSG